MKKYEAIECVMRDNGGTASWNIIYDNITKYYPTARSSKDWQEGIRGVLYRELKKNNRFKRIGIGIYALGDYKEETQPAKNDKVRMHSLMEGICIELGNMKKFYTYTADPSAMFRDNLRLSDIASMSELPEFSYDKILHEARRIDVIWLNKKGLTFPQKVFEVVDSVGTMNGAFNRSLQLKSFMTEFFIVAPEKHHDKYLQTIDLEAYQAQKDRFTFINYDDMMDLYESALRTNKLETKLFG